jgi:hypothetical protein
MVWKYLCTLLISGKVGYTFHMSAEKITGLNFVHLKLMKTDGSL